jgi:PHD/YefM family antitoxin component YafN of YafNO toxin-antitoxin module
MQKIHSPDKKPVVIMKYSKPYAVLINPEEYAMFEQLKANRKTQKKTQSNNAQRKAIIKNELKTLEEDVSNLWKGKNKKTSISNEEIDSLSF